MMDIEKEFNKLLFEEERKVVQLGEVLDILTNSLPRLTIEELRGVKKKWGNPNPIPFDYGELPDYINPADNMGWDIIIAPDSDADDKWLRVTGYVPINDQAHLIPPPFGNKPGNHKLILGRFGKISNQSMSILKDYFEPLAAFETPYFINQGESNVYHHSWKRSKQDILNEKHVMYYAGTSTNNKVKDKIGQWNEEPVIVTADVNEARDIAKDVCRRNGGQPVIYKVQPMGKMLPVHDNSTVTFIVDTAVVEGELDESWEKVTFGSYKLGHVNDGRWGGVAVGPTAKKMVNRLKESLDIGGKRATNLFSKILVEEDERDDMGIRVFVDMDGVLVDFMGGFKDRFMKTDLANKMQLKDESKWGLIEKQIEDYFVQQAQNDKQRKAARHRAKAYFWAVIPGLELGLKKRKLFTPEDWNLYEQRTLDFWRNLQWLDDGKELWDTLVQLRKDGKIDELNILSSPSSPVNIPNENGDIISRNLAEEGKREWLATHGLAKNADRIIIKRNKYEEADGPNDILIDDTDSKLYGKEGKKERYPGWVDADGTGILHTSTQDTLKQLAELGIE